MQLLNHVRTPAISRLNNYLVWPRVNILVFDMASCILKASFSKNLCP
jgi:hypothetical protein